MDSGGFWWLLVDSGGFWWIGWILADSGGFWWVLLDSGGFWWIPVFEGTISEEKISEEKNDFERHDVVVRRKNQIGHVKDRMSIFGLKSDSPLSGLSGFTSATSGCIIINGIWSRIWLLLPHTHYPIAC